MSRHLHALPGGHGHPAQVRPGARQQARTAGHPSVYDRATVSEVPVLTDAVWHALNIVGHYVRVPGAVSRESALEQVDVLAAWYRPEPARPVSSDDCNPTGLLRPS